MNKTQENAKPDKHPLLAEERKYKILEELKHKGKVTVANLSQLLDVSKDTVRRDLRDLAQENKLRKVHGGAMPVSPNVQPYATRNHQNQEVKLKLARVAAQLAQDGQVIFVDSGTTCTAIAEHFALGLSATIVTPSPPVVIALARHKNLKIILIGGDINTKDMTVVGTTAYNSLKKIHADLCFLGVCSIHTSLGVTTTNYEQAQLKSIMVENSAEVVATVSTDKLDTAASFHVSDTNNLNYIVTDAKESNATQGSGGGLEPYRDLKSYQDLGIQIVEV